MRDKLGLSKPRNSGFDCGNLNRGFSAYMEFVVDGGGEGQVESSASTRGVAGWGLGLLSLMRTRFILRE